MPAKITAMAEVVNRREGVSMKICITSEGKTLDSKVDPRFGRCRDFIFFDTDTGRFESQENTNAQFQGGAGIQSAQLAGSKGAKAVLTGNVGPNAFETLNKAGIEVYLNVSGTVKEAIEAYKSGKLKAIQGPSVGSKFGAGK
ncbi:MAG: NifB/NifX family molybdenum-iron cluster-binding protein [Candidatus Omnitrophota bacterium]|jgi:predicted Fe-Mo cluster-binding NifX family protein